MNVKAMDKAFREKVKDELDRECNATKAEVCRTEFMTCTDGRKHHIPIECWQCHNHDDLADRIAELKDRHDR